jgi:hypothetical protein
LFNSRASKIFLRKFCGEYDAMAREAGRDDQDYGTT